MLHQVIETLNSRVALRPRYENFIGGTWVAPVAGGYFDNVEPHHRQDGMPDRALASRRYRACARRCAQGEGRLGQHRAGQARRDPQQDRRPHGGEPESSRRGRDHRQRQADPRDDIRRHSARHRSFPLFRRLRARPGRIAVGDRSRHDRLPLSRAARRGRADHPVELPDPHGRVEARPGACRGKLHRAEAGGADADEHHGADGFDRRPLAARRAQRRQRLRR